MTPIVTHVVFGVVPEAFLMSVFTVNNKKYTPLHHNHEVVCIFYYDLKFDCKKEIERTSSDTSRC